jgi:hypothetical protein
MDYWAWGEGKKLPKLFGCWSRLETAHQNLPFIVPQAYSPAQGLRVGVALLPVNII